MSRRVVVEADGGSRGNPGPAGFGAVVRDADSGEVLAEVAAGIGVATNNVAEYRGLIAGLAAAVELGATSVEVRMDSKLVVEQMSGRWQVKHPDMRVLRKEAQQFVDRLPAVTFGHIPRARNAHADRLANEAMDAAARGEIWVRERVGAGRPDRKTAWSTATGPATTLLLLRHGQTPLSVDRRFSGSGDPALTALGSAQAAAAATRLSRLDPERRPVAVYSSPLQRARSTADAAASALGLTVRVDERLRETDFGDWEGHTFGEVQRTWPDALQAWLADPEVPPPGGESFAATAKRVESARAEMVERHAGEHALVVSHVTPIKCLLRSALEAPMSALYRIHLDLAALSVVDWFADGPAVVRSMNDVGHLDDIAVQHAGEDGITEPAAAVSQP